MKTGQNKKHQEPSRENVIKKPMQEEGTPFSTLNFLI